VKETALQQGAIASSYHSPLAKCIKNKEKPSFGNSDVCYFHHQRTD